MAKLIIEFREPQFGVEVMPCIRLDTDKPTNGDMIKAMFPNIQWDNECDGVFYGYKTNDRMMAMLGVDFNWWNSPYRKEQE